MCFEMGYGMNFAISSLYNDEFLNMEFAVKYRINAVIDHFPNKQPGNPVNSVARTWFSGMFSCLSNSPIPY